MSQTEPLDLMGHFVRGWVRGDWGSMLQEDGVTPDGKAEKQAEDQSRLRGQADMAARAILGTRPDPGVLAHQRPSQVGLGTSPAPSAQHRPTGVCLNVGRSSIHRPSLCHPDPAQHLRRGRQSGVLQALQAGPTVLWLLGLRPPTRPSLTAFEQAQGMVLPNPGRQHRRASAPSAGADTHPGNAGPQF